MILDFAGPCVIPATVTTTPALKNVRVLFIPSSVMLVTGLALNMINGKIFSYHWENRFFCLHKKDWPPTASAGSIGTLIMCSDRRRRSFQYPQPFFGHLQSALSLHDVAFKCVKLAFVARYRTVPAYYCRWGRLLYTPVLLFPHDNYRQVKVICLFLIVCRPYYSSCFVYRRFRIVLEFFAIGLFFTGSFEIFSFQFYVGHKHQHRFHTVPSNLMPSVWANYKLYGTKNRFGSDVLLK